MPNGMVIQNLDNTYFHKGYMYGGINNAGEAEDGIRMGALQNISLTHEFGTASLRGPESLAPLGVGITEENLTGSARFGVLLPSQLKMMFGGTVTQGGGKTTYRKKVNDEPYPFDLHLLSAGPDVATNDALGGYEFWLYNCICTNSPLIDGADNRAFVLRGIDFMVVGKLLEGDTEATLFEQIFPGNLTSST